MAVARDFEQASIPEGEKALYRYLAKINDAPASVGQVDVDRARAAGWSDKALFDAVTVCAAFNFFNRWVDGTGVPDVPHGFYEQRLAQLGDFNYRV